ncbi:hypothetical protein BDY19DRAFT_889784, partial [Irpex rosettiformis]
MLRTSSLRGYHIPGTIDRLITTLFADDAGVYLSYKDKYSDLTKILSTWCEASTAKFNLDKTEVIPIGEPSYRENVLTSRRINPEDDETIPNDIKIAQDGTAVRYLGAWTGNEINDETPWKKVISEINRALKKWDKPGITIFGRRLVINMEVGGRIQYLAKVQGMPDNIKKEISHTIRQFMWPNQNIPMISIETLQRPKNEGGLALLDIDTRVDAITLTWLKQFLDLSEKRPLWAYVADRLIARNALKSGPQYNENMKLNVFMQNWSANTSRKSNLPKPLKTLLNTAKKYNVRFDAIKLSPHLKSVMPIWLH